MMLREFIVREAKESDSESITALEAQIWHESDMIPLTASDIENLFSEHSPYFLVAEHDQKICGYFFGREVSVCPYKNMHLSEKSVHGITIASTRRGAGRALYEEIRTLLIMSSIKKYFGFSRLPGLSTYLKTLISEQFIYAENKLAEVALWYAHETMRLIGADVQPDCLITPFLTLPAITEPDPVLAFHVRGLKMRLAGVRKDYMVDPASCNYSAFVVSEYPHR